MKVDELIAQKAEELHRLHAYDAGRIGEFKTKARQRRRSPVWVLIGAAFAVLLLFGPVALLFRSEDPTSSIPDQNTVSTDGDSTPAQASGGVSIGERLFEMPGDGGLGPVMTSESDLIVTGWDTVLKSDDGGETWQVTGGAPSGDDSLILTEAGDGVLLAVGAHDGSSSRLYRSVDYGATWEQVELPVPPEVVQVVPGVIAHGSGEWVIAGVATQGSFDNDAAIYVWSSGDGASWEFEEVADLEGQFAYIDAVEMVDDRVVILARSAQDARPELFALEETADGWTRTELTPVLEAQAGLASEPANTLPKGTGIVGDRLHAWWSFDDGAGNIQTTAVAYRTGPGDWQAEPVSGVTPETITITPSGLIGTAHPGTLAPMVTPDFTAIVASNDGVAWTEIGRVDGIYMRKLQPVDDQLLLAAGNETGTSDEGFVPVTSAGIWEISLSEDIPSILEGQ